MTSPSLKERVLAATRETPALTRAQWRARALAVALGTSVLWLAIALMHGISQWFAHPGLYMPTLALGFGLTGAVLLGTLFGFSSSPLGFSRHRMLRAVRVTVPLLCAVALLANGLEPQTMTFASARLASHLACPVLLVSGALVFSALFLYLLRRSDPVAPEITALTIGAASGVWAGLSVALQCHYEDPGHVLVTHVLPILIVMWIVQRVGTRVLSVSAGKSL